MSSQGQITTDGGIEFGPRTSDGEPMFSPATVQEGLFSTEAFEQIRGQTALETERPTSSENSIAAHEQLLSIMESARHAR
jgi:hypothetical protein